MSNVETKGTMATYPDWNALKSKIAYYKACKHNVGDMIVVGDEVWRVVGKVESSVALEHVYPEDDRRLSSTVAETIILRWFK